MNIVLLGAGNVASYLGPLLIKRGHRILQVYSPSGRNGPSLSKKLSCKHVNKIPFINPNADLYILAIKDSALPSFIRKLPFSPKTIVHTSGTIGMEVFPASMKSYGVLYPLQTFSSISKRSVIPFPFCIEGSDQRTTNLIRKLARTLSKKVFEYNSSQRRIIHLAAVLVNNFTNYLFTLSSKLLKEHKIDFTVLYPLIEQTCNAIQVTDPYRAQSGPARRGDKIIIKKHLALLKNKKEMKRIYSLLSKSIAKQYGVKI